MWWNRAGKLNNYKKTNYIYRYEKETFLSFGG